MGRLRDYTKRLSGVTVEDQEKAILNVFNDNRQTALDLNTGQLFQGRDSLGKPLMEYHNEEYAQFKRKLNPKGVTDLKLRGSFYKGFFAYAHKFPILFSSTDVKTEMLEEEYGKDIFGLDKESKDTFNKDIKGDVQAYYHKLLSL
jgi:hypothetical protein